MSDDLAKLYGEEWQHVFDSRINTRRDLQRGAISYSIKGAKKLPLERQRRLRKGTGRYHT